MVIYFCLLSLPCVRNIVITIKCKQINSVAILNDLTEFLENVQISGFLFPVSNISIEKRKENV